MAHTSCQQQNNNKSVFRFVNQLTTWHCQRLLLSTGHAAIGQTCRSSMQQRNNGKNRKTDARQFHRPCSANYASSVRVYGFLLNTQRILRLTVHSHALSVCCIFITLVLSRLSFYFFCNCAFTFGCCIGEINFLETGGQSSKDFNVIKREHRHTRHHCYHVKWITYTPRVEIFKCSRELSIHIQRQETKHNIWNICWKIWN